MRWWDLLELGKILRIFVSPEISGSLGIAGISGIPGILGILAVSGDPAAVSQSLRQAGFALLSQEGSAAR